MSDNGMGLDSSETRFEIHLVSNDYQNRVTLLSYDTSEEATEAFKPFAPVMLKGLELPNHYELVQVVTTKRTMFDPLRQLTQTGGDGMVNR